MTVPDSSSEDFRESAAQLLLDVRLVPYHRAKVVEFGQNSFLNFGLERTLRRQRRLSRLMSGMGLGVNQELVVLVDRLTRNWNSGRYGQCECSQREQVHMSSNAKLTLMHITTAKTKA